MPPRAKASSGNRTGGTEALGLEPEQVAIQQFRLTVVRGPDAPSSFVSTDARARVGTGESADLRLGDRSVSHFHCEVEIAGAHAVIRDLGSRNGTFVNGLRVVEAYLPDHAVVKTGRTELRFDLGDEKISVPISSRERFGLLVGRSKVMRAVFARLERAAASDATVLLEGETGTGKELAAESIHVESKRASAPFVVVDCGAVPAQLLESELFGHEKGAFTGAVARREGAFQAAAGGTIFLDEIGELPPELQPKLLRVLDRHDVKPVGATAYAPIDVRVLAATNRTLRAEVNARRFRSDLYYRLAVIEVALPPLRERTEDLPLLLEELVDSFGASSSAEAARLRTDAFLEELGRHPWPGNVRELRNYVERALTLRELTTPTAPPSEQPDALQPLRHARERAQRAFERTYLERLLAQHSDNLAAAARAAGVDRAYLYRLLWRHGLK